jgi:hypothetical protein
VQEEEKRSNKTFISRDVMEETKVVLMPQSILKQKDPDQTPPPRAKDSPFKTQKPSLMKTGPDLLSKPQMPEKRMLRING